MITRLWNSYPGHQHCYCSAWLPSCSSSHSPQILPAKMVCRHISSDLKEMALSMALQGLCNLDVHEFTGISMRSLTWLHSTFRRTGDVLPPPLIDPGCHKPRYWSAMDRYRATLLQRKQVQDMSLWFPYRFRAGWTTDRKSTRLNSSHVD